LVDELARSRIAGELGANLCVEAAAGTGKTTVLVRRVASLLAAGVVTVDQLVVITFTEKAAAELSTRVRDELERRANEVGDDEQRRRLLDAARDLYRAHIETIHSFATALLRERPVEAGIDPLFEVLEGLAAGLDFDQAYERFEDELLASDDPDLERALRREFGLQELREACEHLHAHRYLLPLAHPGTSGAGLDQTLDDLREVAGELRDLLRKHSPSDKLVDVVERIVGWVDGLDALQGDELERLLVAGSRAKTNRASARTRTGAGRSSASRTSRTATTKRSTQPSCCCARTRCSGCSRASRSSSASTQRTASAAGRPISTICCSGHGTCCATRNPPAVTSVGGSERC
jgi:ATP-dependent helicase/nuclease subunit A